MAESTRPLIIIIEDSMADVLLLQRALLEHNFEADVEVIGDGESAMTRTSQLSEHADRMPCLFVLDLNLPRYDGLEVLAHIRSISKFNAIPVAVLTTSDSPDERDHAQRLGVTEYWKKPMDLDEFFALGEPLMRLCQTKVQANPYAVGSGK